MRVVLTSTSMPRGSVETLSERELQVIQAVSHGYSNKEIALRYDISIKSVETYRARAMEKLGLLSRADLVRFAIHEGWLQTPLWKKP